MVKNRNRYTLCNIISFNITFCGKDGFININHFVQIVVDWFANWRSPKSLLWNGHQNPTNAKTDCIFLDTRFILIIFCFNTSHGPFKIKILSIHYILNTFIPTFPQIKSHLTAVYQNNVFQSKLFRVLPAKILLWCRFDIKLQSLKYYHMSLNFPCLSASSAILSTQVTHKFIFDIHLFLLFFNTYH